MRGTRGDQAGDESVEVGGLGGDEERVAFQSMGHLVGLEVPMNGSAAVFIRRTWNYGYKGTQFRGGAAAPDPAAYGLSPPLFQPLTAYAARDRIFPAPARENSAPRQGRPSGLHAGHRLRSFHGTNEGEGKGNCQGAVVPVRTASGQG